MFNIIMQGGINYEYNPTCLVSTYYNEVYIVYIIIILHVLTYIIIYIYEGCTLTYE